MDFKSQIATTREQSEKLLSVGLKPETADMVYHYKKSRMTALEWELLPYPPTLRGKFWTPQRISRLQSPFHKNPDGTPMSGEQVFDNLWGKDIPAWSLNRLLSIMPKSIEQVNRPNANLDIESDGQYWFVSYEELGYDVKHQEMKQDLFEAVITTIEWLISKGKFNKEYTYSNEQ